MKHSNIGHARRFKGRHVNTRGRNGKLLVVNDGNAVEGKNRNQIMQSLEKYLTLAQEAHSSGDRILAEGYYQHADHYQRLLNLLNGNSYAAAPVVPEKSFADSAREVTVESVSEVAMMEQEVSSAFIEPDLHREESALTV